jgi:hypothetical protein
MAGENLGITLGVSRTVTRVGTAPGGKALFEGRKAPVTAERLVLDRWCARENPGRRYRGCRMPPATWATLQAIQAAAGPLIGLSETDFGLALERLRTDKTRYWKLPPLVHVPVIVEVLATLGALAPVLARHAPGGEADPARPGIPDLLLWWEEGGRAVGARFVEVKVGKERLGRHQLSEILFLRGCRCRAGVVRLQEATRR